MDHDINSPRVSSSEPDDDEGWRAVRVPPLDDGDAGPSTSSSSSAKGGVVLGLQDLIGNQLAKARGSIPVERTVLCPPKDKSRMNLVQGEEGFDFKFDWEIPNFKKMIQGWRKDLEIDIRSKVFAISSFKGQLMITNDSGDKTFLSFYLILEGSPPSCFTGLRISVVNLGDVYGRLSYGYRYDVNEVKYGWPQLIKFSKLFEIGFLKGYSDSLVINGDIVVLKETAGGDISALIDSVMPFVKLEWTVDDIHSFFGVCENITSKVWHVDGFTFQFCVSVDDDAVIICLIYGGHRMGSFSGRINSTSWIDCSAKNTIRCNIDNARPADIETFRTSFPRNLTRNLSCEATISILPDFEMVEEAVIGDYSMAYLGKIENLRKWKNIMKKMEKRSTERFSFIRSGFLFRHKYFQIFVYPRGDKKGSQNFTIRIVCESEEENSFLVRLTLENRVSTKNIVRECQFRSSILVDDFISLTTLYDEEKGFMVEDSATIRVEVFPLLESCAYEEGSFQWNVDNFLSFRGILERATVIYSKNFTMWDDVPLMNIGVSQSLDKHLCVDYTCQGEICTITLQHRKKENSIFVETEKVTKGKIKFPIKMADIKKKGFAVRDGIVIVVCQKLKRTGPVSTLPAQILNADQDALPAATIDPAAESRALPAAQIHNSAATTGSPTKCLLLNNLFDPTAKNDPGIYLFVEEYVKKNCSRFGEVKQAYLDRNTAQMYLQFDNKEAATNAQIAMHNSNAPIPRLISAMFMEPHDVKAMFR